MTCQRITVSAVDELIRTHNPLIMDARDTRSYRAERHPEAMNVGDFNVPRLLQTLPKERTLLIYCYHGHSSQHLAELFVKAGFQSVYSLDGGFAAWQPHLAGALLP